MAEYHITTFYGAPLSANPTIIRRTVTSAVAALRGAIYGNISAQAGLDTAWGACAYAEGEGAAKEMLSRKSGSIRVRVSKRVVLLERVA